MFHRHGHCRRMINCDQTNRAGKAGDRDGGNGGGGRSGRWRMEIAGEEARVSARWEDAIVDRSMDHRTLYTRYRIACDVRYSNEFQLRTQFAVSSVPEPFDCFLGRLSGDLAETVAYYSQVKSQVVQKAYENLATESVK